MKPIRFFAHSQLNQVRHLGVGFLPALGYKDCFSTRRYRERATCGRKRVAGRSTVLNLYFFDKQCPIPNP